MSENSFGTAHRSEVTMRGPRGAVREHFGIEAFGVNTYSADAGGTVVVEHNELAGRHEELYVVTHGRARFTVAGDEIDAPTGTAVYVRAPHARRQAVAEEDGTTVLAVGAPRGTAYTGSPWESATEFWPLYQDGDYAGALALLERARAQHPDNPTVLYNTACMESLLGRTEDALAHLAAAVEGLPGMADLARGDDDFAALRDDPRFAELTAERPAEPDAAEEPEEDGPTHAAAAISDVPAQPGADGSSWIRLRKHFDVGAFGVNAYSTPAAGGRVIEEHDETGTSAGGHQELYYVLSGSARFTVAGEEIAASEGTFVFVRDPATRRGAVAEEPGTTVLAVGGTPGQPYEVTPWDHMGDAHLRFAERDYAGAKEILEDGLRRFPGNASALYNLACCESMLGERDAALDHLTSSLERDDRFRALAQEDEDFEPIRDDPRFASAVAG